MDDVFRALADPSRRRLLDSLNERSGQTLTELCRGLAMARQSVSKHLAILESANLVTTMWRGREKLHYLNPSPINDISERWINHYDRRRVGALADLRRALEDPKEPSTMERSFVYTTFIHSTPEQVFKALTEPAFTEQYWGTTFDTDWQVGSAITWRHRGVAVNDPEQVVLECDPPRRLSYTWHTFTPEWAAVYDIDEDVRAAIAAERRSRVTFDVEPDGDLVKLTVVHDDFEPGSKVLEMVSGGWPRVLSEIKTLLEKELAGAPRG